MGSRYQSRKSRDQNLYLKKTSHSNLHQCRKSLDYHQSPGYRHRIFKFNDKTQEDFSYDISENNLKRRNASNSIKKYNSVVHKKNRKKSLSFNKKKSLVPLLDGEVNFFNSKNDSKSQFDLDDEIEPTPRFRKPTITAILKSPHPKQIRERLLKSPINLRRRRKMKRKTSNSQKKSIKEDETIIELILKKSEKKRKKKKRRVHPRPKDFNPVKSGYKYFNRAREISRDKIIRDKSLQKDRQVYLDQKRIRARRQKSYFEYQRLKNKGKKQNRERRSANYSEVKVRPHNEDLRRKIMKHSNLIF